MREKHLDYDSAFNFLKEKRKCVKPNTTFEQTLRGWNSVSIQII